MGTQTNKYSLEPDYTRNLSGFLFLHYLEDIYLKYNGEDIKPSKTLIETFDLHNSRMEKINWY